MAELPKEGLLVGAQEDVDSRILSREAIKSGLLSEHVQKSSSWVEDDLSKMKPTFIENETLLNKLLVVGGVLVVIALLFAVFIWATNWSVVTPEKVDIEITGPQSIDAAKESDFVIMVRNNNRSEIHNVMLLVEYPESGVGITDEGMQNRYMQIPVGVISGGSSKKVPIKGVLYGQVGEEYTIKARVQFSSKASAGIYGKDDEYKIALISSPVSFEFDAPKNVSFGQEYTGKIKIKSTSDKRLLNVRISIKYPENFSIVSSSKKPEGAHKSTWRLGMLDPGKEEMITFSGVFSENAKQESTFIIHVTQDIKEGDIEREIALMRYSKTISVGMSALSLTTTVSGIQNNGILFGRGRVPVRVLWRNMERSKIEDAQLEITVDGPLEGSGIKKDEKEIFSPYMLTKKERKEFSVLLPNAQGSETFFLTPSAINSQDPIIITALMKGILITEDGKKEVFTKSVKTIYLNSPYSFTVQVLGRTSPFSSSNAFPPKVGSKIVYGLKMNYKKSDHAQLGFNKITVHFRLPEGVDFAGFLPRSGNVEFDQSSRSVLWRPISDNDMVTIGLSLTPLSGMVGTTPEITSKISVETDGLNRSTTEFDAVTTTEVTEGEDVGVVVE